MTNHETELPPVWMEVTAEMADGSGMVFKHTVDVAPEIQAMNWETLNDLIADDGSSPTSDNLVRKAPEGGLLDRYPKLAQGVDACREINSQPDAEKEGRFADPPYGRIDMGSLADHVLLMDRLDEFPEHQKALLGEANPDVIDRLRARRDSETMLEHAPVLCSEKKHDGISP